MSLSSLSKSGVGIIMVLIGVFGMSWSWVLWLPRVDLCFIHGCIATLLMFVGGYIDTEGTWIINKIEAIEEGRQK